MQRPCTAATLGVGEMAHQPLHDVEPALVVGVEHDDDLAAQLLERGIERA